MVSLFARRVTLSAYRSSATYSRILPSSASVHCDRGIPGTSLHTGPVRKFPNSQRNASTSATATTDEIKSTTTGRKEPVKKLTPKQQEAQKRRAEMAAALAKRKEAATLLLKHLTEKEEKLAKAEAKEGLIKPPPRFLGGFSLFLQETLAGKGFKETAANWHNLSEEARQEYIVRARAMTAKRGEEFDAFAKTVTQEEADRYNHFRKAAGLPRIVIQPATPFTRYAKEFRARPDQAGKSSTEARKAATEAWRSLAPYEKDKYKSA